LTYYTSVRLLSLDLFSLVFLSCMEPREVRKNWFNVQISLCCLLYLEKKNVKTIVVLVFLSKKQ
jgi:hypothetical protein